jgi:hypothetical protein
VKITGEFIVGGVGSAFRESSDPLTEEDEDPYDYREDMEQWEREQYYKEQGEDEEEDVHEKVVVLFPGAFKPPHAGHFAAAKHYADNPDVDEVNIIISRSDRAEHTGEERLSVTPEMSLDIWNQYIVNEPKITAAVTSEASPIRAAYEEINKMPPGSTVMFVVGEKDSDLGDTRYAAIPEYAAQRGIKYATNPVTPEQTGVAKDLSATEMRRNVLSRNKRGFFAQLPRHLGPDQKENIFNLLQRGIQKKINESISSLADIRRLVEEVMNEVESEKQRRWACAQLGDDFKGEKELTKAQAKEFCAAEVEEGAVGSIPMGDIEGYGAPDGVVGSERRKKKDEEDDELEELSSMGGGSIEGYAGPGQRDGKKKKKNSIIREDDEQYVREVLDYILTRGTVNANRS